MTSLTITDGWLNAHPCITRYPSPNYSKRPDTSDISLLVIHHISLPPHQFGGDDVVKFFTNQLEANKHSFYPTIKDLRVSAHAFIRRNGAIIQFVNFNDIAWHAGDSSYQGRSACNDFSIGIELEGDEKTPYRYGQYQSLVEITRALVTSYPRIANNITGHENIAPKRKTDPGPTFDWNHYRTILRK